MLKKGFTLAEVLVTLGIIGIVAALTIPQLVSRTANAHIGPQYAKAIATLENGIGMLLYDYNVKNALQTGTITTHAQLLTELVNGKYVKLTSGGTLPSVCSNASSAYMLADKSVIGICTATSFTVHSGDANQEWVLVSSKASKNSTLIEGFDYLRMSVSADGMIYIPGADYDTNNATCTRTGGGKACAGLLAKNGWKFDESVYTD